MTTYITTPIYYVNDRPHIGHCYTTLLGDVTARFHRLMDPNPGSTFFLTGTDEHADKVVTSAAAHNVTPQQWADRNAAEFEKAFAFMNASHDDFIRTTQERHKTKVLEYIRALQKRGDIYLGDYTGWFDASQEEYLTETAAKEANYVSPVTGVPLVKKTEKNYFFKLSAYEARLKEHFAKHPEFVQPEARRNEVLGRLNELRDIPISRAITDDPTSQWGIKMPDDPTHRIYVWIDALFNYLSVVDTDARRKYWPASVHFIAKDILWFHAVIWPALLMALRDSDSPSQREGAGGGLSSASSSSRYAFVQLPKTVYSHAYWVREGRKMSKSLGNFVSIEVLQAYAAKYGLDAVRWYLITQGPQGATDADFSHAKFVEVYNAELANGIGNCASRVSNMIEKYFGGSTPAIGTASTRVHAACADAGGKVATAMKSLDTHAIASLAVAIIREVDAYINDTQPFKLAKTVDQNPAAKGELGAILANCAEAIRVASVLMSPAMPQKMAQLWQGWNCAPSPGASLADLCVFAGPHALKPGQKITKGENLFNRADAAEAPPA